MICRIVVSVIVCLLTMVSANAVTLFPYFTDVAGNYNDGIREELSAIGVSGMYSAKPSFYSSLNEADAFLKDVLPFSSEKIDRIESVDKETRVKTVKYVSPMLDGKMSVIYLVEIPKLGFFAAYEEKLCKPQK